MKPKYIIWFACILLLGGLVVWWLITPSVTVNEVNHLIEKEVPSRASVAQVITFLDSHEIGHSELLDEPEGFSDFRFNPKLEGKRENVTGIIQAVIRDVQYDFLMSWHLYIYFYFDEQGRLVEYTVTKIGVGM